MSLIFLPIGYACLLALLAYSFGRKSSINTKSIVNEQKAEHYAKKLQLLEATYQEIQYADNWLFGHRAVVQYLNCRYDDAVITHAGLIDILNNDRTFPIPFHQSRHARIWLRSQVDEWYTKHYVTNHSIGE